VAADLLERESFVGVQLEDLQQQIAELHAHATYSRINFVPDAATVDGEGAALEGSPFVDLKEVLPEPEFPEEDAQGPDVCLGAEVAGIGFG
jgi:hypothetical protein